VPEWGRVWLAIGEKQDPVLIWKSPIVFECGNCKTDPASGYQNTHSMKIDQRFFRNSFDRGRDHNCNPEIADRFKFANFQEKTALPFDPTCCTLAFPEFGHWLLPVNVFAAPGEMLRLA